MSGRSRLSTRGGRARVDRSGDTRLAGPCFVQAGPTDARCCRPIPRFIGSTRSTCCSIKSTKRCGILQAYLNHVYFGDGYYGVEAASRGYFAKSAATLNAAESATLAAPISRPSGYALRRTPARIRARRDGVLRQMRDAHQLDDAAFGVAIATPVNAMLAGAAQRASVDPAAMS